MYLTIFSICASAYRILILFSNYSNGFKRPCELHCTVDIKFETNYRKQPFVMFAVPACCNPFVRGCFRNPFHLAIENVHCHRIANIKPFVSFIGTVPNQTLVILREEVSQLMGTVNGNEHRTKRLSVVFTLSTRPPN